MSLRVTNIKGTAILIENNLTTGAFTPERMAVLNLICSRSAISLENARRYRSFKQVAVDQSSEERRTFKLRGYMEDVLLSLLTQTLGGKLGVVSDRGKR